MISNKEKECKFCNDLQEYIEIAERMKKNKEGEKP